MPSERIVCSDKFDDPNLPGEMLTTVSLRLAMGVMQLQVVQEAILEANPVERWYLGWQESPAQLSKPAERENPD